MLDVTLYIPSHNDSHAAIESVGSSPTWRTIISDNASDGDHAEALQSLASPRVTVIRHEEDLGRLGNYAWCVEHFKSSGVQWFKMLSAGDRHTPNALDVLTKAVRSFREARFIIPRMARDFGDGVLRIWEPTPGMIAHSPEQNLKNAVLHGNVFDGMSTPLIHRSAIEEIEFSGWPGPYCADFHFLLRIGVKSPAYYLPIVCGVTAMCYRKTYAAMCGTGAAKEEEALVRALAANLLATNGKSVDQSLSAGV